MDTERQIKEQDSLSDDVGSQNESEAFTNNVDMNTYTGTVFLHDACEMVIKTEIKSEAPLLDICVQKEAECFTERLTKKQIKAQAITYSGDCEMDPEAEMGPQEQREFLPEHPVMEPKTCNSDHEMSRKIKIEQEPSWPRTETSSVCDHIKGVDFTTVKSPRLATMRCSNSCEVDATIQTKEGDPLLDKDASLCAENVALRENDDTALLNSYCDVVMKTEDESETCVTDLFLQKGRECFNKYVKQIKSETVTCSSNCAVNTKTEIGLEQGREFLPEDPVMQLKNYNSDDKMHNKIEIKEEYWWLEKEASSVSLDTKDGDSTQITSPRLCMEGVPGDGSALPSARVSRENISFSYGKDCPNGESPESDVTKLPPTRGHIHSEQPGNCSDVGEIYSSSNICDQSFTHSLHLKSNNFTHEGSKPYTCEICNKSFTRLSYLRWHYWTHEDKTADNKNSFTRLSHNLILEGRKILRCEMCDKIFPDLSHLNRHMLIHGSKKPHKCAICDKSFTLAEHLKRHNLTHEDKRAHKCEQCEKSFSYVSSLKAHALLHQSEAPYRCELCHKNFAYLSSLKSHNLIHEGKAPHKCQVCDKSFAHLGHFKSHSLIHEGTKPHKCQICHKSFTALSSLKRHHLTHEGRKPHKCDICHMSFTQLSHLKRHNLTHGVRKPYKCEICEEKFVWWSDLKSHNLIHEGKQPHKCEVCNKMFPDLSHLKRHALIHGSTKPHKCTVCNKSFTLLQHLKRHSLRHEVREPQEKLKLHKCVKCDKTFSYLSSLKVHKLIHEGKRPHQCSTCEKTFTHLTSLRYHKLIHEGKKPHKCLVCHKRFTHQGHLKSHNLIHQGRIPQ